MSRIEIVPLEFAQHSAWDEFVGAHPEGCAAHLSLWAPLVERLFGHKPHYLLARDADGAVRGVLPLVRLKSLLFGDYMVSVPYLNNGGVLALDAETARKLLRAADQLAKTCGCGHVEYRFAAELDGELTAGRTVRTDKVAMQLVLPSDEAALGKSLGAKLRSQIRRPQKEGAVAVRGRLELLDEFYAVFARNMRDLGTPVYPRSFFAAILEAMSERAEIVVVRVGDVPAAAGFLMGYRGRLEIPWASADRRFNRISVNMLLYWEVLRGAIEQGYEVFDFGRSSKDAGTYKFGWSGESVGNSGLIPVLAE